MKGSIKSNPVFASRELKDIESWTGKLITPGVISKQTVSKPSSGQSSTWLVDNGNKEPTKFYYFDLPGKAISTKKWNNCGNKKKKSVPHLPPWLLLGLLVAVRK